MMIKFKRFNTYLCLAAGLLLAAGCESDSKTKNFTAIELHLEVNADGAGDNETVTYFRNPPITVNVDKEPFLDTPDVEAAKVMDDLGGFKIVLKFNWRGTQLLSSMTAGNLGKRIAVFCVFGQNRWLAAPVTKKAITDGVFSFTPDATREEAEQIVKGINEVAAEIKKNEKI
jgi:preprotein translocase subunit SecD